MIQPIKVFLLILYVSIFLGALLLLPNEIHLSEKFAIKIPKIDAIWKVQKTEYADISKIREQFESDKDPDEPLVADSAEADTLEEREPFVPKELALDPETRIQYPEGESQLLYNFFRSLKILENTDTLIRVVHFGDSQLEGDRITSFLREKFQEKFGGCGVGIANVVDKLHSKLSIAQQFSPSWQKHVVYGPQFNRNKPNFYGILGDYHTFGFAGEEPSWTKETFTYSKSPYASPLQQKVEEIKVLYRTPEAPAELSIATPQGEVVKTKLESNPQLGIYTYSLEGAFENIQVGFASGTASPEVYGVALDCKNGISFDNVPLRGSSGIEFTRINTAHLKRQFEALGVKLLIMQFGVNIVPNPLPDYTFYENMFYQQLKHLKSLVPDLDILVVGVSDMSYNLDGNYQSYPNIVKIRNAQKKAAFRAQCAFWDLYEAMGGENSMPSWVFAEPEPLANKDFTHFTGKGASIVAEMLYKALILEYFKFNEVIN